MTGQPPSNSSTSEPAIETESEPPLIMTDSSAPSSIVLTPSTSTTTTSVIHELPTTTVMSPVLIPSVHPTINSSATILPSLETTVNISRNPHEGAYSGFMVVLPPPPNNHHHGEMTEYQRSLHNHQQHLILYGLAPTHPKPYPGCPNIPHVMNDDIGPPKVDFNAPPAYESVAKPPTYEEVQREKHLEERLMNNNGGTPGGMPLPNRSNRPMTFLGTIDNEHAHRDPEADALLGTDFMFLTAFIVAFLLNWIGFLLLICFCHTVAARYGALSGFGISLAKWTFIVRTSSTETSHENDWLWWLIMAFGFLICIRAFLQYLTIKRSWNTLSEQAQERFFFIY